MHRSRSFLGATALGASLITATLASAQGAGSTSASSANLNGRTPPVMAWRAVAALAPVELLLDKAKDVQLDGAQKKQIETTYKPYKSRIDSLLKAFDAAQWSAAAAKSNARGIKEPTPAEQLEMQKADQWVQMRLIQIRETYVRSEADALALLTDEQKAKARPLLEKLRMEMRATPLGRARIERDKLVIDTLASRG
jgi:hypothetical protein